MADEHFFPGPADFSSGLGAVPFFGSSYAPPGLDAQAAMQGFGMMAWADDLRLPADSSAAHFDSALSSLVSSPAHNCSGDDVAIGDLIGRLGSICNAAAAAAAAAGSASNSCYSTPLSSPPRGALSPAAAALAFRGCYQGGAVAFDAGTGRLSRVASSKSLGAAATPPEVETSPTKMGGGTEMAGPVTVPPAAKGDGGAARKRKASGKGKAASSSAMAAAAAATNASPKRSKVAAAGGGARKDDEDTDAAAAEEEKPEPEPAKDYIHVRARRGQATDSHSLAERVRRERISERMKMLQSLVPGCNKITGKALMLDEIINYVQSLQRQVEFLSMKLATMNPELMELDTQQYRQLPAASKDTMPRAGAMATTLQAYPTAAAALSPYAADPFFAAHPTQLDYSCTATSFHPAGWEAQDLQSMLHHSTAVAAAAVHGHHDLYASPSPPAPQPHHHSDNSFHGQQQQQQSHMKLEQP